MRILGIDPGSQITGYGVVDKLGSRLIHVDNGGIFTHPGDAFAEKLRTIFSGILELIERHRPDCVALENIFVAKNVKSSSQLGHARGAVIVAAARESVEAYDGCLTS